MRVRKHFIIVAAVVAVTMFGPSNASAWGYSQHGYGSYFGLGRHFGFGRHYGFGRHHRYGRRHYRGRSYALPPAHSRRLGRNRRHRRGPRVELPGLHDNGRH